MTQRLSQEFIMDELQAMLDDITQEQRKQAIRLLLSKNVDRDKFKTKKNNTEIRSSAMSEETLEELYHWVKEKIKENKKE